MTFFKHKKKAKPNKQLCFFLLRYVAIVLLLLSFPFFPARVPQFSVFFASRYWLIADILVIYLVGEFFEKKLVKAIYQDIQEKKSHGDALNASTILFAANPILFLLDIAAFIHLYGLWFQWSQRMIPDTNARLQTAALTIGLVLVLYGKFMPTIPLGSIWGIVTKYTKSNEAVWKQIHTSCSKRFFYGGIIILILVMISPPLVSMGMRLILSITFFVIIIASSFLTASVLTDCK